MRKKILLIDDDESFCKLLKKAIVDCRDGYDLLTAQNGEEGVRLTEENKPEVIFCDKRMPGLDGIETCRRINELCDWNAKVVMIADTPISSDIGKMREIGIENYYIKPGSYEALIELVQKIVDPSSG